MQQGFRIITRRAHGEIPSTQMDVKLLTVFDTATATAGIGPHSRIYNFLNQVDLKNGYIGEYSNNLYWLFGYIGEYSSERNTTNQLVNILCKRAQNSIYLAY